MVNRVILLLAALYWLLLPATSFAAAPTLTITVKSDQVEFGKPISITLHTRYLQPSLHTLDLSPLDKDFVADTTDNIERDVKDGQQSWRIRLYPRQPGDALVPSFVFHGIKTEPIKITVTPSVNSKDNTRITVSNNIGDSNVWINQRVQIIVQVEDNSPYAWLDSETTRQDGVEILALPHTKSTSMHNGVQHTQHRIGWILYPQTTGTISIQLPPVKYHRDGDITHRFYPPKIKLHVRALPEFIPPTMPVGQIQLEASMPDHVFLVKRKLGFLTLHIKSEGPPVLAVSEILRQFKNSQSVSFYPPREMTDDNGSEKIYQIPFASKITGLVSLPSLRLQYFDTTTGKIETRNYSLGSFLSLAQWLVYIGAFIMLLIATILSKLLYRWSKQQLQVYQLYRMALHKIQHARTPVEIKSALMDIAGAESWSGNLTLPVWLSHWLTRYPHLSSLSDDILRLQTWLYGQTETSIDEIRHSLINICYQRMPLLKIHERMQRKSG